VNGASFDVVVVGAGAGGAAAAYRLCRRGLSVLLLDAGPRFDPLTDYPLTEADWEARDFPQKPIITCAASAARRCISPVNRIAFIPRR
jgi:choline dehydrogenase-like flavoprotein